MLIDDKEKSELEIEVYELNEEPRIRLDIHIGNVEESVIIVGEDYLKQVRTAIDDALSLGQP